MAPSILGTVLSSGLGRRVGKCCGHLATWRGSDASERSQGGVVFIREGV